MASSKRDGSTGPAGDRTLYYVEDLTRFRRGGLGVVHEAVVMRQRLGLPPGSRVGLKMLTGVDAERFEKILRRSIPLREISHPNLARQIECFAGPPPTRKGAFDADEPDQFFSVHEWVDGTRLDKLIPVATCREILGWGRGLARAVDFLHSQVNGGFAHRDVHPRNVIVRETGQAVLIDWDTVLWIDAADTHLVNLSGFGPPIGRPGLAGAQSDDRVMLANTLLRAFARDVEAGLDLQSLEERALAELEAESANPHGVVERLKTAISSPPSDAGSLLDDLQRHFDTPPSRRPRWRSLAISAAGVVVAAGASAVVLLPQRPASPRTGPNSHVTSTPAPMASPTISVTPPPTATPPLLTWKGINASLHTAPGGSFNSLLPKEFDRPTWALQKPSKVGIQFYPLYGGVECGAQDSARSEAIAAFRNRPELRGIGRAHSVGQLTNYSIDWLDLITESNARRWIDVEASDNGCGNIQIVNVAPSQLLPDGALIVNPGGSYAEALGTRDGFAVELIVYTQTGSLKGPGSAALTSMLNIVLQRAVATSSSAG